MTQNISVVIIDSDTDSINNIVKYIKSIGSNIIVEGVATTFESGFELIHKKRPIIVIMEVGEDIDLTLGRITQILNRFPQVSIFATCADKSSDTILKVMRSGATEYLLRPVLETDLTFALQKLGRLWLTKPIQEAEAGHVLTVYSPKGGVGVTTIAINLATNIYEATKKPTILVDLDLNAGDVTTFLNIKPSYTISDIATNISRLDKSFLQGVITKHESGIFVLAEPQKVEEGLAISGTEVNKVLSILKTMFSFIIIDTEPISDRTTTAIKMSDIILLICNMSLTVIRNTKRHLKFIQKMDIETDKIKVIANRYMKKGEIRIEDTEKAISYPIFRTIPDDYNTSMACLNKGVPISVGAPKSQLNVSMKQLAEALINIKKSKGGAD